MMEVKKRVSVLFIISFIIGVVAFTGESEIYKFVYL